MDTQSQQNLNQLPIGSTLGDFTITGIVGEGGFGIVYLAYEAALDRVVAIKEYLPSSIAGRTGNQSVMVRSQLNSNAFASGLKNFLREAKMLAKFSHPALVEVHRVWEQNSTAYMAMRYYEGKTLREWRLVNDNFDEGRIRRLIEPVLDGLSQLHAESVIHRDVSPDNILMRSNGQPVLLDLGAARLVVGGMAQAFTTILKPGYAPIEQYVDDGTMHQGPWTDVYGLGAVLYYLLTGAAPPQAVSRMITDPMHKMASIIKVPVPQAFIDAVVKALAVHPENRYQSVEDLRDGLGWTEPLPAEPRTQYTRADNSARGAVPATGGNKPITAGSASTTLPPPLPTAVVRTPVSASSPSILPAPALSVGAAPFAEPLLASPGDSIPANAPEDDEKTVIWSAAAVASAASAARAAALAQVSLPPRFEAKAEPMVVPAPVPTTPLGSAPAPMIAPAALPRSKAYGDTPTTQVSASGKQKTWLFVGLAALVASVGGYFALNRTPSPVPAVATVSTPTLAVPTTPPEVTLKSSVATPVVAPSIPPPAPPPPRAPVVVPSPTVTPTPAAVAATTKAADPSSKETVKETAGLAAEEEKLAKAKREAQDKAKAEAQEKAAKAKADNDERVRKLRLEAEERAAAVARADQEEKARRTSEEEDRLAAAKAKQEAERVKAPSVSTTGGLVVTPPRRTVEELSAAGAAAFKRGELAAARVAWNELVTHTEATARSKATAYNNLAISYCQNSDEINCERMYASMLRADRAYGAEVSERELPQFKRAYDRAARQVRGPGY